MLGPHCRPYVCSENHLLEVHLPASWDQGLVQHPPPYPPRHVTRAPAGARLAPPVHIEDGISPLQDFCDISRRENVPAPCVSQEDLQGG